MDDFGKEKNFGCKEKYGTLCNSEEKVFNGCSSQTFFAFFCIWAKKLAFFSGGLKQSFHYYTTIIFFYSTTYNIKLIR